MKNFHHKNFIRKFHDTDLHVDFPVIYYVTLFAMSTSILLTKSLRTMSDFIVCVTLFTFHLLAIVALLQL